MNEEKEPLWFVWERVSRGGMVTKMQASIYRGMPSTGTGQINDNLRFVFKHKILPHEEKADLDYFVTSYPCPIPQDVIEATRETDLKRNELSREAKKEHLAESFKVKGPEAEKILDEMYGKQSDAKEETARNTTKDTDKNTSANGLAGEDYTHSD